MNSKVIHNEGYKTPVDWREKNELFPEEGEIT